MGRIATETPTDEKELDAVDCWRVLQFTLQGYSILQVDQLLEYKIDLHDTERLLQKGCSHEMSIEILRA